MAISEPDGVSLLSADGRLIDETLLLQSRIAQLKHPQRRVLEVLRQFYRCPYHILHGKARDFLSIEMEDDLVAIKSPAETDYLSAFLRRHISREVSTGPVSND